MRTYQAPSPGLDGAGTTGARAASLLVRPLPSWSTGAGRAEVLAQRAWEHLHQPCRPTPRNEETRVSTGAKQQSADKGCKLAYLESLFAPRPADHDAVYKCDLGRDRPLSQTALGVLDSQPYLRARASLAASSRESRTAGGRKAITASLPPSTYAVGMSCVLCAAATCEAANNATENSSCEPSFCISRHLVFQVGRRRGASRRGETTALLLGGRRHAGVRAHLLGLTHPTSLLAIDGRIRARK